MTRPRYAELHAHSNFSFLDGASHPEDLVAEADRLGLDALAITDHDGLYGAPAFAEAAQDFSVRTIFGAELSLDLRGPKTKVPDPDAEHLLVIARGPKGYRELAAALTDAHLRGGEKGQPVYDLDELIDRGREDWLILTGCRKSAVRSSENPEAALRYLTQAFNHVVVELTDHGHPTDTSVNDALAELAKQFHLPIVATNNVHYSTAAQARLGAAMAAIRARKTLTEMNGWLPASPGAHLRSAEEMHWRFRRYPGAVARSVDFAEDAAFHLRAVSPRLPKHNIPPGHTASSWLRVLVERNFDQFYPADTGAARQRVESELEVINRKDFAGYFLIVHDIVAFARERGILCQGRGSAAASAVCFVLGITAIDPVFYQLPFERFLSEHRDEAPDIDVDFDSERREEVIQWVYETYGRRNAAQVANVITYRERLAIRDAAAALGYSVGAQDAWSKHSEDAPDDVRALADQLKGSPRHLGIHSGGMVLTEEPVGQVCPIEHARMPGRTVLQWDKHACSWMGLVKFDLLGLGMLNALDHMLKICAEHYDEPWTLATLPKEDPAVYDMLGTGDSIGVFQVESRAQIGTLPRLKPRNFYQLAVEIGIIRPGPIQGGSVHPYIRRATGQEPVTYPHPDLIPVLERTLGVPLFQEQLMALAVTVGDCTPDEADALRRAMGSKRGVEKIDKIKESLYAGMARHGLTGEAADDVYRKILSFGQFGFAESHALSFALLVYASSWFKLHHPDAFLAGLLRAQPMGFYAPHSLVDDARRHGVIVVRPDINASAAQASVIGTREKRMVRLGLSDVRLISREVAERLVQLQPFSSLADVSRRGGLNAEQMEALATADAFRCFSLQRREAIWLAGYPNRAEHLQGTEISSAPPALPLLSEVETTSADLWSTSIAVDSHVIEHYRPSLPSVLRINELTEHLDGRRVTVAGLVTHRQRPPTARGMTFLNLEDETGMLNVVCSPGLWRAYQRVGHSSAALLVRGLVEYRDGVLNLIADRLSKLA